MSKDDFNLGNTPPRSSGAPLDALRRRPLVAAAAGLGVLIAGAAFLGLVFGGGEDKPGAVRDPAPAASPHPAAPDPDRASPAAPVGMPGRELATPSPARAAPVRPAALPLSASPGIGAREAIASGGDHGNEWIPLSRRDIREGMPMASIRTQASRDNQPRGWPAFGWMRVTRSGLFRVETAGDHALLLSTTSPDLFGPRSARCSVAVGDPGSELVAARAGSTGDAAAAVALAEGWHWLYLTCDVRSTHGVGEVAITAPDGNAPELVALHLPEEAAPVVPAQESEDSGAVGPGEAAALEDEA